MTKSEYDSLRPGDIIVSEYSWHNFIVICKKEEGAYWIVKQHAGMPSLHILDTNISWERKIWNQVIGEFDYEQTSKVAKENGVESRTD